MNKQNDQLNKNEIVVIGAPFDAQSSYLRGAASAPVRIIEVLYSDSANLSTEKRRDLGAIDGWRILPDIDLPDTESAFGRIETAIADLLAQQARPITLGGDHSITYPIIRAFASVYPDLNILHLDAHPDLYDELDGNRHSHACPFARIMEAGLAKRLVQVGIRTMTPHQHEQAMRFGVEVYDMNRLDAAVGLQFDGPVYLSLDMDCLDPAFAPGVSHHEPGGMSTRELLRILQTMQGDLVGADIVEYNPERDINGVTGMTAAKLLKEVISKLMATQKSNSS